MRKPLLVLAVAAALTVAVFAASGVDQRPATVGEFAVKLARVAGTASSDAKTAAQSLKSLGVNVGADLNATLTEDRAARILADLGFTVKSARTGTAVSLSKADSLASLASAATIAATSVASTDLPAECLQSPNRGTCVDCCKAAVGPITNAQGNPQDPGLICTNFCASVLPPGHQSPSEPTP